MLTDIMKKIVNRKNGIYALLGGMIAFLMDCVSWIGLDKWMSKDTVAKIADEAAEKIITDPICRSCINKGMADFIKTSMEEVASKTVEVVTDRSSLIKIGVGVVTTIAVMRVAEKVSKIYSTDSGSNGMTLFETHALRNNLRSFSENMKEDEKLIREARHIFNKEVLSLKEVLSKSSNDLTQEINKLITSCEEKGIDLNEIMKEINDKYICPLTLRVISDPVCTPDGRYFERVAIKTWYEHQKEKGDVMSLFNDTKQLPNPDELPTKKFVQVDIKEQLDKILKQNQHSSYKQFSKV